MSRTSSVHRREKGGKEQAIPANRTLEGYLDSYVGAAGVAKDRKGPLFRSATGRTGQLIGRRLSRSDVLRMIYRCAEACRQREAMCRSGRERHGPRLPRTAPWAGRR
jgi:hypothetical protein